MPKKAVNVKRFHVLLPEETFKELDFIAVQLGLISKSEVVRYCLNSVTKELKGKISYANKKT